ncbi:MarR family transcriptional regulator [Nonomuraea sp. NPDC050394]|uniref:MarR family transcriptional regulator n=1 Tax=Nonomuraea sp. NPDC050394 TaxID=3364363 RepID=UPI0037AFBF12
MKLAPEELTPTEALLELCCVVEGVRARISRAFDLTPQQAQLLTALAAGPLSHGELATRMHCDKANVTGLVDRLERRELIRRRPDPSDRRVSLVSLTHCGTELVERFKQAVSTAIAVPLTSLAPTDLHHLATLAQSTAQTLRQS